MKKKFIKNLIFFLTLNILIKPAYVFGIDRVVQNNVGAETYGSYFPLLNLVLIFQVFLDLGIENYTRKEVGGRPDKLLKLFPNMVVLKFFLSFLFISIFSIIGFVFFESRYELKLLLLLLVNQSMASFILYLRSNMGGLQIFKSESVISVLDRLFMIVICGSLLLLPQMNTRFKMEWFVIAQSVSYGLTLAISSIVVLKKTGWNNLQFSIKTYTPIFKRLWPFTLLTLLMAFYYRIDSIFLRFFLEDGATQAGIYAHGFRILDFMSNYALIFALILVPTFAKMIARKEQVTSLLKLASLALLVPSLSLLIGIFFYRFNVFSILYKEHIELSANVFGIMIISFLGVCVSYTYGALLTAKGCLKELNIMATIAVVLSILLNLILIPRYKVLGAALSNSIVQLFTLVFHVVIVKKKFNLKVYTKLSLKFISFIVSSILVGALISRTNIQWYLGLGLISMFSIFFAMVIKLLRISYVRELLRSSSE